MSLYIRGVLVDQHNGFDEVKHVAEFHDGAPDSVGFMSVLFGAKKRTAPPYLAQTPHTLPMSAITRFYDGEWNFGFCRYSITREELKKLTPELVIEDRRPHGHGSPLPEGEPGVMTTAGEYLHEDSFAFVKRLLNEDGNIFHFFIG